MSIVPYSSKWYMVAEIIASSCRSVDNVRFDNALLKKIAEAVKLGCDSKLRQKLWYFWNKRDKPLYSAVSKLLNANEESRKKREDVKNESDFSKDPKKPTYSDVLKGKVMKQVENSTVQDEPKILKFGNDQYVIRNVLGDGNCLFRSFSFYLHGHEEEHFAIRSKIVQFVVENWAEEKELIFITGVNRLYKDADQYENVMGENREFGTDYELSVFVRLYGMTVTLFKYENGELKFNGKYGEDKDKNVTLMFTGDEKSGHWLVLNQMNQISNDLCVKLNEDLVDPILAAIPVENNVEIDDVKQINADETFILEAENEKESVSEHVYDVVKKASSTCTLGSSMSSGSMEVFNILLHAESSKVNNDKNPEGRSLNFDKCVDNESIDVDVGSNINPEEELYEIDKKENNNLEESRSILKAKENYDFNENASQVSLCDSKQDTKDILSEFTFEDNPMDAFESREKKELNIDDKNNEQKKPSDQNKFFRSERRRIDYKLSFKDPDSDDDNKQSIESVETTKENNKSVVSSNFDAERLQKLDQKNSESDSSEANDSNETSDTDDDEDDVEMPKKKKKVDKYVVDLGEHEIHATDLKDDLGKIDHEVIRSFIKEYLYNDLDCTCSLRYVGSIRHNRQEIVLYAKCRRVNCKSCFRFYISNFDGDAREPLASLIISSNKEFRYVHDDSDGPMVYESLRGKERKQVQEQMKYRRVCTFVEEQKQKTDVALFKDGHAGKLRKYNTYCKAASEKKCEERLKLQSRDLADLTQLWIEQQKKDDPFLRSIGQPLTARMYRETELDLALEEQPLILHMDATGSYVRKPYVPCKQVYYYTILFKGKTDIVKIAHMITASHTVVSISTFLKEYRYFVKEKTKKWPIAKVATVDWSWVFIHGLSSEWNEMNIVKYLKIMYNYCEFGKLPSKDLILIKLCYAHFMHMVSKTIKEKFPAYKEFKSLLLKSMALLCLSRDLSETDMIFKNIIRLFGNPNMEEVKDYITVMTNQAAKHPTEMNILEEQDKLENDKIELDDEESDTIYRSSPFYQRYEAIAITTMRDIHPNKGIDCDDEDDIEYEVTNKFYAPKFIEHLRTRWMPYIVMWSGLDLKLLDSNISRITNAYIESSNRTTKEIDFGGNVDRSIADRVRQLENRTTSTMASEILDAKIKPKAVREKPSYPTIDENDDKQKSLERVHSKKQTIKVNKGEKNVSSKSKGKKIKEKSLIKKAKETVTKTKNTKLNYPETEPNPQSEETWMRNQRGRRGRGYSKTMNINEVMQMLIRADAQMEKEKLIKQKNEKKLNEEQKSKQLRKTKKNTNAVTRKRKLENPIEEEQNDDAVLSQKKNKKRKMNTNTDIIEGQASVKKEEPDDKNIEEAANIEGQASVKKEEPDDKNIEEATINCPSDVIEETQELPTFCNGLVHDVKYYFLSRSSRLTIARYTNKHSVTYETFQLYAREYSTLKNKRWIDGIVIDSFVSTYIDEWADVSYVPTDDSSTICGDYSVIRYSAMRRINKKAIYNTTKPIKKNLLIPYSHSAHWRLLFVKVEEEKILLLDPYGTDSDKSRAVNAFIDFTKCCSSDSSFATLRHIKWEVEEIRERPYQPTNDGFSCGSYVMYYLYCLGSDKPFDIDFDPMAFRNEIAYTILLKSENMTGICLHCFRIALSRDSVICLSCNRKCHIKCLFKSDLDTDTEEEALKKKVSEEPVEAPCILPHTFTCKLCKRCKDMFERES